MIDDGESQKRVKSRNRYHFIGHFSKAPKWSSWSIYNENTTWRTCNRCNLFRKGYFHALPRVLCTARLAHVCLVSFSSSARILCVFWDLNLLKCFVCFSFFVFWECGEAAGCGFSIQWLPRTAWVLTVPPIWSPFLLRYVNNGKCEWIYGNCKRD